MGKKHNQDIVPIKRRRYGVSKTAERGVDWALVLSTIRTRADREKFLRIIGRK